MTVFHLFQSVRRIFSAVNEDNNIKPEKIFLEAL